MGENYKNPIILPIFIPDFSFRAILFWEGITKIDFFSQFFSRFLLPGNIILGGNYKNQLFLPIFILGISLLAQRFWESSSQIGVVIPFEVRISQGKQG
ncbi:MAG: hypothetical protein K6G11_06665 [Lachnospiraceae bacterium]|nr:hypothetical protein [Lachnospiraceae bacterium]